MPTFKNTHLKASEINANKNHQPELTRLCICVSMQRLLHHLRDRSRPGNRQPHTPVRTADRRSKESLPTRIWRLCLSWGRRWPRSPCWAACCWCAPCAGTGASAAAAHGWGAPPAWSGRRAGPRTWWSVCPPRPSRSGASLRTARKHTEGERETRP